MRYSYASFERAKEAKVYKTRIERECYGCLSAIRKGEWCERRQVGKRWYYLCFNCSHRVPGKVYK